MDVNWLQIWQFFGQQELLYIYDMQVQNGSQVLLALHT